MRRLIVGTLLVFAVGGVPAISHAATRVVVCIDNETTPVRVLSAESVVTIDNKKAIPIGGTYREFSIGTCAKPIDPLCSGKDARLVVDDVAAGGSADTIFLTDYTVMRSNNPGSTGTSRLRIFYDSDDFTGPLPPRVYPYAVIGDGTFLNVRTNFQNIIGISGSYEDGGEGGTSALIGPDPVLTCPSIPLSGNLIDNPLSASSPNFSGIKAATTSSLKIALTEWERGFCNNTGAGCRNRLTGLTQFTLLPGASVRLPGSTGVIGVTEPVDEGGEQIITDLLASHFDRAAGTAKVVRACLTPSPGGRPGLPVRELVSSETAWLSSGCNFGGNDLVRGSGETQVEITKGGMLRVTTHGLCPADGCKAMDVGVSAYCGGDNPNPALPVLDSVNGLTLDKFGNGRADFQIALPCFDPAVLIREPRGFTPGEPIDLRPWIAASGIQ